MSVIIIIDEAATKAHAMISKLALISGYMTDEQVKKSVHLLDEFSNKIEDIYYGADKKPHV